MTSTRIVSAAMVVLTATPWSLLMVLGGIWLLTRGAATVATLARGEPGPMLSVVQAGGVFWVAAGHLLFMSFVADRMFPRASRRLVSPLEFVTSLVLFACVAWLVVLVAGVLGGG